MSATNRGLPRQADDHYETPGWAVRAILDVLPEYAFRGAVLDAGCGKGNIAYEIANPPYEPSVRPTLYGVELNARRVKHCEKRIPGMTVYQGDFLDKKLHGRLRKHDFHMVIMNPPYSHALAFIQATRSIAPAAILVCLTRLNWIAGARERQPARKALLTSDPPVVCVLERRPSFGLNKDGKPGTDGTEYAWLVWGADDSFARDWMILECAPSERKKRAA